MESRQVSAEQAQELKRLLNETGLLAAIRADIEAEHDRAGNIPDPELRHAAWDRIHMARWLLERAEGIVNAMGVRDDRHADAATESE